MRAGKIGAIPQPNTHARIVVPPDDFAQIRKPLDRRVGERHFYVGVSAGEELPQMLLRATLILRQETLFARLSLAHRDLTLVQRTAIQF